MLTGCIGALLLAISAPVMWLKRRRRGRLDAPPVPSDERIARRLTIGMLALGLLFPLTGATMLLALLGQWAAQWRRRVRRIAA